MESDSDGEPLEADYSSMKQPPLIKQLRGILSEYPDGGQIIKELLQNAEDAGASEVSLLYESRRINRDKVKGKPYRKFFQGPALCLYNDAVFTEQDWEGIQMIYSSVKEDDRQKVGRFGLGFKSVFHITDYPCVISGDRVLCVDPQQSSDKVNASMKLSKLTRYKGFDYEAFMNALDGTFNIDRNISTQGHFTGTIFWFPLREEVSPISETLYNEEKVMSLFNVFKNEAENILIFLRSLTSISLNMKESDESIQEIANVKLAENIEEVTEKRLKFKSDISQLQNDYIGKDIQTTYTMTIHTFLKDKGYSTKTWMIVNMFIGESASPEFRARIQDPSNGNSPYVGAAIPILQGSAQHKPLEGHVYCFLPLPKEGSRLTGLPVHINGFFALNQSRHHLKWQTDEQVGITITDKDILWNKFLINEALPLAYEILIKRMTENGHPENDVPVVYDAIPNLKHVKDKWKLLVTQLMKQLVKDCPFLYFVDRNNPPTKSWLTVKEATFATLGNFPQTSSNVKNTIIKTLLLMGVKYVDVPTQVFDSIDNCHRLEDLSPARFADLLRRECHYKGFTGEEKVDVLDYLTSDNDYTKLSGLELLPLASGSWISFNDTFKVVNACSDVEMQLFPGLEGEIIQRSHRRCASLDTHLQQSGTRGLFQIRQFNSESFKVMLRETVRLHLINKGLNVITKCTPLTYAWLKKVWEFIFHNGIVGAFEDTPLVPKLKMGDWSGDNIEIELHCLKEIILLEHHNGIGLPTRLTEAIRCLSVEILPSLPDWFTATTVQKYISIPTPESIVQMLSKLKFEKDTRANCFNSKCSYESKDSFVAYISNVSVFQIDERDILKKLTIFRQFESPSSTPTYVSLMGNNRYIQENVLSDLPISYPYPVICASPQTEKLLSSLNASKVDLTGIVLHTVEQIIQGKRCESDVVEFMKYFLTNYHKFENHRQIVDQVKNVEFLKSNSRLYKPSDLFNHFENDLLQLFIGETKFPEQNYFKDEKYIHILKRLGLKSIGDVDANDLLEVAETLDSWSESDPISFTDIETKAHTFLQFLNRKPELLQRTCKNGAYLVTCIEKKKCIKVERNRNSSFPTCLPWYKSPSVLCRPTDVRDIKYCLLVGSTVPLFSTPNNLSSAFNWDVVPPEENILDQLKLVKQKYLVDNRTEMLAIVKSIYNCMGSSGANHITLRQKLVSKKLVWNGDGFCEPTMIFVSHHDNDLDLRPYFYRCPNEFLSFEELYRSMGCFVGQSVNVFLNTLQQIKEKHECKTCNESEVQNGIAIAGSILDRLAEHKHELVDSEDAILVPVQTVEDTSKYGRLTMKNVKECVYDKENLGSFIEIEEDGKQYYVHEDIKCETARTLGVKSVNVRALSDTEGFERWGQDEPLTARISTLLREGYVDGLSVPKELMQNADDAGASTIKFLYDERTNDDAKQKLLSSDMKECQGPSLWVYNDATFSAEDLINITKLNGATKQNDAKTIGKFGLGFCSVYNLTDVPSFVTGNNIVMFDPHMTYLQDALPDKNTPGLRIDLTKPKNRNLLRRHCDQFKPYEGIFNCKMSRTEGVVMQGTLFRFPLRTAFQSKTSQISSTSYSRHEMIELLRLFVKSVGNLFLFTQNVKTLEIYHLPSTATSVSEASLLYTAKQECLIFEANQMTIFKGNVLERAHTNVQNGRDEDIIQKRNITLTITENGRKLIDGLGDIQSETVSPWLVAWSTGKTRSNLRASHNSAIALSAIAIPCRKTNELLPEELQNVEIGFYRNGHIFCFLPMPLTTDLPLHINGYFDVTSDRRQLLSLTEDDKGSKHYEWNTFLMSESLVHSFLILLQMLATKATETYVYHCLWPAYINDNETTSSFKVNFYRKIIFEDIKLFNIKSKWFSFNDVVFLDESIITDTKIGHVAYEMLQTFNVREGKTLVKLPVNVLIAMQKSTETDGNSLVINSIITSYEMLIVALKNLQHPFWIDKQKERDTIILRALQEPDQAIKDILLNNECIPVEPNGLLRKPSDIINPTSDLCHMFNESDRRFLTKNPEFKSQKVIGSLISLGMIESLLPGHILIERCDSITGLAEHCCQCASERCWNIVNYLSKYIVQRDQDKDTINILKTKHMLPVLAKPNSWKFQWQSEKCTNVRRLMKKDVDCVIHPMTSCTSIVLGQPSYLYRQDAVDFIATVKNVIDESGFSQYTSVYDTSANSTFQFLGVSDVSTDKCTEQLVKQLINMSTSYQDKCAQFTETTRIFQKIFIKLNHYLESSKDSSCLDCIKPLNTYKVVLIGDELFPPNNVAFNVIEECAPNLMQLPKNDKLSRKKIYSAIGVKESFSVSDVIRVLQEKKEFWKSRPCSEIEVINNLLINLESSMIDEDVKYVNLQDQRELIVCPDTNGILRPTYDLIIDDENYQTSSEVHIVHNRIVPKLVIELGVKLKDKKCLEEISCAVPFGQKEKLVTRIKRLLSSYPCDSSIMKELLQNADDAEATEIHFITDFRSHECDLKITSETVQGPSLCVFNDSYFKESDFEGIHNLGIGSKGDDPSKTGQYGVGFNAVYHITDTPSFLTKGPGQKHGGSLCIFDPLLCHVHNVTEIDPGMRYSIDGLKRNFPNALSAFSDYEQLFESGAGTLFRLPLRSKGSELGEGKVTKELINELLESFKCDMIDALLFLKNVNSIKVSDISSGTLIEKYEVKSTLSADDLNKRNGFFTSINEIVKSNKGHKVHNLESNHSVYYNVHINDSKGQENAFFVVQAFGFGKNISSVDSFVSNYENECLGYLPLGGIAMPLGELKIERPILDANNKEKGTNTTKSDVSMPGKAYCFLPLPIKTGLPLHINGHFALDHESRRNLWMDGFKHKWNMSLVEFIIVPSYTVALCHLKTDVVQSNMQTTTSWKSMNTLMRKYHDMFPIWETATSEFWKAVVSKFYKYCLENKMDIFPIVDSNETKNKTGLKFETSWTSLSFEKGQFDGVFDNVYKHLKYIISPDVRSKISDLISNLLRRIGMKLISTPNAILKTLSMAGFKDIQTSTPDFVIEFMKSDTSDCDVGQLDTEIQKTKFENERNLSYVVEYIMLAENIHEKIEGLPVVLTADKVLRKWSSSTILFNSEYWHLLPKSGFQFLHESQLHLYTKETLYKNGVLKRLDIQSFLALLPDSLNSAMLTNGSHIQWNKQTGNPVEAKWICNFFVFLYFQSLKSSTTSSLFTIASVDHTKFQENVNLFGKWALLPSTQRLGQVQMTSEKLVPISASFCLLYRSTLQNEFLYTIIDKFNLPSIDRSVFEDEKKKAHSVLNAIQKFVSSTDSPTQLLQCFLHYLSNIVSSTISVEDGMELLSYFGKHIDTMIKQTKDLKLKLRCLPFYVTLQQSLVSVTNTNVVVVPKGLPTSGIEEWASTTGYTILQEYDSLRNFYTFIGLGSTSAIELYVNNILPSFSRVPKQFWIQHITYIRDELLMTFGQYSKQQKQLLNLLKNIAFVEIGGVYKRANELYDIDHPVFKAMLTLSDFPPPEFQTLEWKALFVDLEMDIEPNDEIMIRFASEIETASLKGDNSDTARKSAILVNHFVLNCEKWATSTLVKMKSIKFIAAHDVGSYYTSIHEQMPSGTVFTCFNESVSSLYREICWTSANILNVNTLNYIGEDKKSVLGVFDKPPVEAVILHCQNVCEVFVERLANQTIQPFNLERHMEKIYEYFNKHLPSIAVIAKRLQSFSIIYLPEEKEMIKASDVVIELSKEQTVKPYLFSAPIIYGKYHNLFHQLGSQKSVTCVHYSSILKHMKEKMKNSEATPPEKGTIRHVLKNFCNTLDHKQNNSSEIDVLFLPDKKMKLVDSNLLVLLDNRHFADRLSTHTDINYFIGFKALKLSLFIVDAFRNLSAHVRPRLLSKVITEEVTLNNVTENESSRNASVLTDFIQSALFIHAVLRLVKHFATLNETALVISQLEIFGKRLKNAKITSVKGLKTVFKYKGNFVPGSESTKRCVCIEKTIDNEKVFILYFEEEDDGRLHLATLIDEKDGPIDLVCKCIEAGNDVVRDISIILRMYDKPTEIAEWLDKNHIDAFDTPLDLGLDNDLFPKPGTYVEERFHPFLEQGMSFFKSHEFKYVAMELEDSSMDFDDVCLQNERSCEPIYIYVRIRKEIDEEEQSFVKKSYLVDTGTDDHIGEIVPLYRLYRFVRHDENTCTDMTVHTDGPVGSVPFDKTCKRLRDILREAWELPEIDRRRVIRRLWLKWHPDKNPGNTEYATRVFNYLQDIILRLENGETIDEDVSTETGRSAPDLSRSSYHDMGRNMNRRAESYSRAFRDNEDDYNRATNSGRFAHAGASSQVRPDYGEAQRWIRQAKCDFKAAETSLEDMSTVQGYNWICYICHQASEKALKAGCFAKDGNSVPTHTHSLTFAAMGLSDEMLIQARSLEHHLGEHTRMRYPDRHSRPEIPSTVYLEDHATKAIAIAKTIVDLAEEYIV